MQRTGLCLWKSGSASVGVKTINKVDIFLPSVPWTILAEGVSDLARLVMIFCVFHVKTV